jgi:ribosome-associated translation inhibitor RaiA
MVSSAAMEKLLDAREHSKRCGCQAPSHMARALVRLAGRAAARRVEAELKKGNRMKVQVNASNDIQNKESLESWATEYLNERLARFEQDITSIEVQLTDENHATRGGGADKRCMLEARVAGRAPVAVTAFGNDQNLAFRAAGEKLEHALDHVFGKLDRREHRVRDTIRKDAEAVEALASLPPQS